MSEKMNVAKFRNEIESAVEEAYSAMANESLADTNEPIASDLIFAETDADEVQRRISSELPLLGHILWIGGGRTPFEARRSGSRVLVTIGAENLAPR
ncbi:hypothetical protein OP10G_3235 [Fimbriimonas ginsengisoli Gsoil 348]|uniref:Uncharacterized protein n=2 Tax=Fimbriimonas ginsengisoli TaxID=1005039 RepID=A0A068NSW2_FIMGI|nr:hypothetical protein OP10G_3235 [Fimbriimonas ginsengisoli Gsoil 348]